MFPLAVLCLRAQCSGCVSRSCALTSGTCSHVPTCACRIREDDPGLAGQDKMQGLLFTAVKLELGNLVGVGHNFAVVQELPVVMQVKMRGRVINFAFEHSGQLYRIEVCGSSLVA